MLTSPPKPMSLAERLSSFRKSRSGDKQELTSKPVAEGIEKLNQKLGNSIEVQKAQLQAIKKMDERITKIENISTLTAVTQALSYSAARTKLGGAIDELYRVLGAMHNHADGYPGFHMKCAKCHETEVHVQAILNIADTRLLQPGEREVSGFENE